MAQFEYVASGTAHTRILAIATLETPEVQEVIKDYFRYLNGLNSHKFSLLFNAFTEADFGPRFKRYYADAIHGIHADSGGLQIITQGLDVNDELKDGVYRVQAACSDVAMCFDEIPVGKLGKTSGRNSIQTRFFDADNLEPCARLTGKNIKRQIELFLDEKTTAKPMIISQGNDYETYMRWIEYVVKEIPTSYYKHIGGLALGAAALGTGLLEDVERAAYAPHLPFQMDNPYYHILGVGSLRRLLPYLALIKSGYYPENTKLSYDSTTHTSGISIGLYYFNGGGYPIDRTFINPNGFVNHMYRDIYTDLDNRFSYAEKGIDLEMFYKGVNTDSSFYHDRKNKHIDIERMKLYYHMQTGFYAGAIANFTADVEKCASNRRFLIETAIACKLGKEIPSLLNCTTLDDFLNWKNNHGNLSKKKRVAATKPVSLWQ